MASLRSALRRVLPEPLYLRAQALRLWARQPPTRATNQTARVPETPRFYMRMPLPGGGFTDGEIDYTGVPRTLGLDRVDMDGLRVLDVAANDGFWSFWAERQGAAEVLAIDVDSFAGYDWGRSAFDECQRRKAADTERKPGNWEGGRGFAYLKDAWQSQVRRETLSVYDLDLSIHGAFDVVFCYGLLYHLRHPLLAIERMRDVCAGFLVLETHIVNVDRSLPISYFYWDDTVRAHTNWIGPTEAACAAWFRSAGFDGVFVKRPDKNRKNGRATFIATTTAEWTDWFAPDQTLTHIDDTYFSRMRQLVREAIGEF